MPGVRRVPVGEGTVVEYHDDVGRRSRLQAHLGETLQFPDGPGETWGHGSHIALHDLGAGAVTVVGDRHGHSHTRPRFEFGNRGDTTQHRLPPRERRVAETVAEREGHRQSARLVPPVAGEQSF